MGALGFGAVYKLWLCKCNEQVHVRNHEVFFQSQHAGSKERILMPAILTKLESTTHLQIHTNTNACHTYIYMQDNLKLFLNYL